MQFRPARAQGFLRVAFCLALVSGFAFAGEAAPEGPRSPLDFRAVIRHAKAKVFPAVVYIRCIRETREGGKLETEVVGGSGVLVDAKGEFVTNWHVVDKAVEVRLLLQDGRARRAEVLGSDKDTDLALCRVIDAAKDETFPVASIGSSEALTEGDVVMAMGAPWGMARSVSLGIVACTRRYLTGHSEYSLWLQTDASISPGNSGGPLVNTDGEIIGINTRGVRSGGDMGFAVPSSTMKQVLPRFRDQGKMPWSWTGVQLQALRDFNRNTYFEGDEGVIVAGTAPESPARRAGIQPNDRLLALDGESLTAVAEEDLPAIRLRLALLTQGEPVPLKVLRGDETLEIELMPRAKGDVEGKELHLPRWDFSVKEINQFDNPGLFFHRKKGVFVHGVRRPGNASSAGLARNDILLKIGGVKVENIEDVKSVHEEKLAFLETRSRVLLTILRNGLMRQIVLEFARDYERK